MQPTSSTPFQSVPQNSQTAGATAARGAAALTTSLRTVAFALLVDRALSA